jgi:hypothetical protein
MKTIFPFRRRVLPVLLLAGLSATGVATAQENAPEAAPLLCFQVFSRLNL